jgi:cytochrome oxidase Cu insertion factor (SCO1/SenC/PrrC family)/thiol-disulfide isomerase/thioredoxin
VVGAVLVSAAVIGSESSSSAPSALASPLATNPNLDPGTSLSRPAPDFTLVNQFGQPVSLRSFRGKVVVLAFNDAVCTTMCPLTTTALLDAKRTLGAAGSQVQLLGVDANPAALSVRDVLAYSQVHGMVGEWQFLTGSLQHVKRVWNEYGVAVDVTRGLTAHTPAVFLIDATGRLRKVFLTQQSYAAVGQVGQVLAHAVANLLPGRPQVHSSLTYAEVTGISPSERVLVSRAGGGSTWLGPEAGDAEALSRGTTGARLYVFFASWDREVGNIGGELESLNRYQSIAARTGLPPLTAVDEGSVEPSGAALTAFLRRLPAPLTYPVAIDTSGRIADGYEVQAQPWFVLASGRGQILWYLRGDVSAWPKPAALLHDVRAALSNPPRAASTVGAAQRQLAGSPEPLAALHAQANDLLGSGSSLGARVAALRGYPIVVNLWASWCTACQTEYPLLRAASVRYGRRVAFIGIDTEDQAASARSFMAQHWLSYPSYQSPSTSGLQTFLPGGLLGLPTTFFISRAGRVVHVNTGEYAAPGTLEADIRQYALGG